MKFKVGDKVLLNRNIKGVVVFVDKSRQTTLPYLIELDGLDCINYNDYNALKWTPTAIWTDEYALKLDELSVFDEFDFEVVWDAFDTILRYKIDLVEELVRIYKDTNSQSTSIFDMISSVLEDEIDIVGEALERLVELQKEES